MDLYTDPDYFVVNPNYEPAPNGAVYGSYQFPFGNVYISLQWIQWTVPAHGEEDPAHLAGHYESFTWLYGQWVDDESGIHTASVDTMYMQNGQDGYHLIEYYHCETFWGSAPDGKVPSMLGRDTGFTGKASLEATQTTQKQPLVYDESDYSDDSIESILVAYFAGKSICGQGTPDSYLISVGAAKEGDLVGVIVIKDSPIYVWRKTDEDIKRTVPEECPDEDLIIGSNFQWAYFGSYRMAATVPCVEFHNPMPSNNQLDRVEFLGWGGS